jgi:KAP family P-loop domain
VIDIVTPDLAKESRVEPLAPRLPVASGPPESGTPFAADLPAGADALGLRQALRPLAQLAVHRDTEAPLTIALLGAPGSGKSFALATLLAEIETLSGEATGTRDGSFLSRVAVLRIDAAGFDGEPSVSLAAALYDKLEALFPEFVREVGHAVRDPQIVAREAAERLDEARRRLDAERQKLEEIESRRARLPDTVLFESAGSQVDAYARANRTKFESRLVGFGISGDPIANYKSMVRDIAGSGGPAVRFGAALRAFWAFKGQTRLLSTAAILALIGIGLDSAFTDAASWLAWLRSPNQGLVSLADGMEAHIGWLTLAAKLAYAGAALALAANVWRGIRLLRPLFRGVSLLGSDVAERRRALDALYAHQMRRVDGLDADVELAARRAAEADRRASASGRAEAEPSPFADATPKGQADRFFAALGAFLQGVLRAGTPGLTSVPQRLVIALDEIDAVPQEKIRPLLETVHRAFANAGIITLIAVDPARIRADGAAFEKWIQVPFRIDAAEPLDHAAYVAQIIGKPGGTEDTMDAEPIDWSMSSAETSLLGALAPLAGSSPRAVKRFVNLYRIARAQVPDHKGALALMLALEQGGTGSEVAAVREGLADGESGADLAFPRGTPRLFAALQTIETHGKVSVESARRAAAIAAKYSFRG